MNMKQLATTVMQWSLIMGAVALVSCGEDDSSPVGPAPTGQQTTYDLNERAVDGISGTVSFVEQSDSSTTVLITLMGTPDGGEHPAHIHMNTAAEGGDIIISLTPVDGGTGISETNVSADDNGAAVTYSDLLEYDGYVNVHLSADDLGTIVAQGDIGQNALTGETKEYTLNEMAVPGISGTATFAERENGEALATLALTGTPDGGEHPAHIHMNTAEEGGDIVFTFVSVDGTTGMSMTNVAMLDDETAFGYSDVLEYDGYINVHLSADDLATLVAQGNIGANE